MMTAAGSPEMAVRISVANRGPVLGWRHTSAPLYTLGP